MNEFFVTVCLKQNTIFVTKEANIKGDQVVLAMHHHQMAKFT